MTHPQNHEHILHIERDGEPVTVGATGRTHGNVGIHDGQTISIDVDGVTVTIEAIAAVDTNSAGGV